jgi:CHAD domain-containing protein
LLEAIDCGSERRDDNGGDCFGRWAAQQLTARARLFLATVPEENADMSELHQFRIRAKALRYTIELLASALGGELRETHYRTIEEVQERLGKINDHVAARDRLRDWAADISDVELQEVLCRLAEEEVAQLATELAAWHEWWTAERIKQLREGLGRAA